LLPNKIKLKISAKNFPSGCAATNGSKTKDSEISIQRGDIENFNQFGLDGPGEVYIITCSSWGTDHFFL